MVHFESSDMPNISPPAFVLRTSAPLVPTLRLLCRAVVPGDQSRCKRAGDAQSDALHLSASILIVYVNEWSVAARRACTHAPTPRPRIKSGGCQRRPATARR